MLTCFRTTQLLSEAQDRELTGMERISLGLHTLMCSGCRNFSYQMPVLRKMARSYAKDADVDEALFPDDR